MHLVTIADLHVRVRSKVIDPDRIFRSAAHGADEDVVVAILDSHQRCLARRRGLVTHVRHDNHGQPAIAEGVALGPIRSLVKLYLLSNPAHWAWDIFTHEKASRRQFRVDSIFGSSALRQLLASVMALADCHRGHP